MLFILLECLFLVFGSNFAMEHKHKEEVRVELGAVDLRKAVDFVDTVAKDKNMSFELLLEAKTFVEDLFAENFLYLFNVAVELVVFVSDFNVEESSRYLERSCIEVSLEQFNVHRC